MAGTKDGVWDRPQEIGSDAGSMSSGCRRFRSGAATRKGRGAAELHGRAGELGNYYRWDRHDLLDAAARGSPLMPTMKSGYYTMRPLWRPKYVERWACIMG
jgi:hypothetical protein